MVIVWIVILMSNAWATTLKVISFVFFCFLKKKDEKKLDDNSSSSNNNNNDNNKDTDLRFEINFHVSPSLLLLFFIYRVIFFCIWLGRFVHATFKWISIHIFHLRCVCTQKAWQYFTINYVFSRSKTIKRIISSVFPM